MLAAVTLAGGEGRNLAIAAGFGAYLLTLVLAGSLREEEFAAVKRLWRTPTPHKARLP
jgi:hypothetical protein